jgi:hypothetical protein
LSRVIPNFRRTARSEPRRGQVRTGGANPFCAAVVVILLSAFACPRPVAAQLLPALPQIGLPGGNALPSPAESATGLAPAAEATEHVVGIRRPADNNVMLEETARGITLVVRDAPLRDVLSALARAPS